jgi:hypothetical protein
MERKVWRKLRSPPPAEVFILTAEQQVGLQAQIGLADVATEQKRAGETAGG